MKSASFKNGHTKFVSGLRTPESDNGDDVSPNRVHPLQFPDDKSRGSSPIVKNPKVCVRDDYPLPNGLILF